MNIVIVGNRDGRRIIRWSRVMALAVVLSIAIGSGVAVVYRLLSGEWQSRAALLGVFFGVLLAGIGLINGLKTPLNKLRRVE